MGNFKVKTDKQTYNQVRSLLLESGFRISTPTGKDWVIGELGGIISSYSNWRNEPPEWFYTIKEITLPELRDMVVLKRNNVSDATHENSILKYFKACDDWYYFDLGCTDKWQKSAGAKPEYYEKLKPIEKTMKEYLDKQQDGTYNLITASGGCVDRDWIEVPEGADFLCQILDELVFYKSGSPFCWWDGTKGHWRDCVDIVKSETIEGVLWKRYTQPEALTFIDDSPQSINDQYAEIEQVRQASKDNVNNPQHYNKGGVECIDAIEASMTPEAFKGYLKGNVQKYMWRYEQKGGVESLYKAQWYLERLVASMDS